VSKQHAGRPDPAQAEHQGLASWAHSGGTRYIFARMGAASRRCRPLGSLSAGSPSRLHVDLWCRSSS
jgi:hypothetical protein